MSQRALVHLGFAVRIFAAPPKARTYPGMRQLPIIGVYVNPPSPTKSLDNHDLLSCGVVQRELFGAKPLQVVVQDGRFPVPGTISDTPLFPFVTSPFSFREAIG